MGESDSSSIMSIVYLVIMLATLVGMWKVFAKAGEPGWAAIIPIYNVWVMVKIAARPWWWFLVILIIPCANIILAIIVWLDILRKFSKPAWHIVLILFFSFAYLPWLGFGDAEFNASL